MNTKPELTNAPQPSFEEALTQLEAIIERIEGGEVGLEQCLAEYERGVGFIRRCKEILERAEQRVEELTRKPVTPDDSTGRPPAADVPF